MELNAEAASGCLRRLGRRHVFDDEDALAGLDQAELAPRDLFDRGRILAQAPGLFAQPRVLGALTRDRRRQAVVLVARAQHRQQPAIADEAVDDNDGGDEKHQHLDDPPVARRGASAPASDAAASGLVSTFFGTCKNSTTPRGKVQERCRDLILILTTMPDDDRADGLARTLVEERLAACVNVHAPMTSTYRWQGQVEVERRASARDQDHARPPRRARDAAPRAASVRAAGVRRDRRVRGRRLRRMGAATPSSP